MKTSKKLKFRKGEKKILKNLPGNKDIGCATDWMVKNSPFSKQQLIGQCLHKICGLDIVIHKNSTVSPAECKARILVQPRLTSKGDPRGSVNNPWGHIAYLEKMKRRIDPLTGKLEKQKFRMRARIKTLPPLKRNTYVKKKDRVAAEKIARTARKRIKKTA